MAVWWQFLTFFCCTLSCGESFVKPPDQQRNKYNSLHLTTSTRTRVQRLNNLYKEQQLGNKNFEDRSRQLENLPLLSTDFYSWLMLTDWERLNAAVLDLQTYWNMLEWKRKQLEKEKQHVRGQVVHNTLTQSFKHIQLDLRDLMSQVNSQVNIGIHPCLVKVLGLKYLERNIKNVCKILFFLSLDRYIQRPQMKPTSPTVWAPFNPESNSKTVWDRRVEGYIILRDLDLYLIKLARDFLLLASKNTTQH
ncbi:LOW QUALITY PROTEIN: uncharacterized protein [Antennarius striatus]|uniref:LOW QUALITY PROTEIN: uncharacterized protein n=1 Tax=Antennarius striatus TaxID=241820 RepID=UPI0035B2FB61